MSNCLQSVLLFSYIIQSQSSEWNIVTDPALPYPLKQLAAATFNSSIFLTGTLEDYRSSASDVEYEVVEYDTELDMMNLMILQNESLTLRRYHDSYSNQFTQVMDQLFLANRHGYSLSVFDLETGSLDTLYLPNNVDDQCLTSSHDTLFVISYAYYSYLSKKMVSLNISSNTWTSDQHYPAMWQERRYHACAYQPMTKHVYAFGDQYGYDNGLSFEKLPVKNSYYDHESWTLFDLTEPIEGSKAVGYEQYIFIYGGYVDDGTSIPYRQNILVLNALTDEFLPSMELNWKIQSGALVIVPSKARAYMFGGISTRGTSYHVTSWQYYDLPFTFDTAATSETPTQHTTSYTTTPTESTTSVSPTPTARPSKGTTTTQTTIFYPTVQCKDLHFICFYNDYQFETSDYIKFVSLLEYSSMMRNATLSSIESVTYRSVDYDQQSINSYAPWKRGGILYFEICNVFGTELSDDCPQYKKRGTKAKYIAIGTFGMVVDQEMDKFSEHIIDEMTSDDFAETLTQKMHVVLKGIISDIAFEVVEIKVIGDCSFETTEVGDFAQSVKNKDAVVVVVVVLVVLVVLIVTLLVLIRYFKKHKDEEEKAERKEVELAEQQSKNHKTDKDNVQEGVVDILDDINRVNETYDVQINKDADDDIVNEINQMQRT